MKGNVENESPPPKVIALSLAQVPMGWRFPRARHWIRIPYNNDNNDNDNDNDNNIIMIIIIIIITTGGVERVARGRAAGERKMKYHNNIII